MNFFKQAGAILRKDIVSELRTKEMITPMFLFVISTMVIFSFAFKGNEQNLTPFVGGMLWVAFLFTSILGLNRSFVHEKDEGCIDGLLMCPVDRPAIYFGKMIGNLIFISIVELIAIPIFWIFFITTNFLPRFGLFILVLLLSNIGISAIGTLFATMSVNSRFRDMLLPILTLPVIIPLLIWAASTTSIIIVGGKQMSQVSTGLNFLLVYDIIFLLAAYGLYDYVIGE